MTKKNCTTKYRNPALLAIDSCLSHEDKIKILKDWAREEYSKAVADEENMCQADAAEDQNILDKVLNALLKLGVEFDPSGAAPDKLI